MERARKIQRRRTLPYAVNKQHKRVGVNGTQIITVVSEQGREPNSELFELQHAKSNGKPRRPSSH